jgi:hypothetical protein
MNRLVSLTVQRFVAPVDRSSWTRAQPRVKRGAGLAFSSQRHVYLGRLVVAFGPNRILRPA